MVDVIDCVLLAGFVSGGVTLVRVAVAVKAPADRGVTLRLTGKKPANDPRVQVTTVADAVQDPPVPA